MGHHVATTRADQPVIIQDHREGEGSEEDSGVEDVEVVEDHLETVDHRRTRSQASLKKKAARLKDKKNRKHCCPHHCAACCEIVFIQYTAKTENMARCTSSV